MTVPKKPHRDYRDDGRLIEQLTELVGKMSADETFYAARLCFEQLSEEQQEDFRAIIGGNE